MQNKVVYFFKIVLTKMRKCQKKRGVSVCEINGKNEQKVK